MENNRKFHYLNFMPNDEKIIEFTYFGRENMSSKRCYNGLIVYDQKNIRLSRSINQSRNEKITVKGSVKQNNLF